MARPNALKWYDGPSLVDGSPIIGVVSGLQRPTRNTKTGDLFQTWIMPRDVKPNDAVKTGDDRGVCADCPMRPINHKAKPVEDRPCYVKTFQGPRSVWQATHDKPVASVDDMANGANRRTGLRFGAWGGPTAIPYDAWWDLLLRPMAVDIDIDRSPGYTHRWRDCDQRWRGLLMASVHSVSEAREAWAMGWRTFRIGQSSTLTEREIMCAHLTNGVKCVDCGLCDGAQGWHAFMRADGRADIDRRRSIVNEAH